jgi:hypothetical protein
MRVLVAEVTNTTNFVGDGAFYVLTKETDSPIKVQYVTPYLGGNSGFVAIPEIGTRVLICQPDNDEYWYYLGSTPNFGLGANYFDPGATKKDKQLLPDPELYKARSAPQRYVFMSPKGGALILSDSYNPDYFNCKAELQTGAGKGLRLIDSPLIDCVILENEHGDRIRISSKAAESMGPQAIEIEAKGAVDIVSRE